MLTLERAELRWIGGCVFLVAAVVFFLVFFTTNAMSRHELCSSYREPFLKTMCQGLRSPKLAELNLAIQHDNPVRTIRASVPKDVPMRLRLAQRIFDETWVPTWRKGAIDFIADSDRWSRPLTFKPMREMRDPTNVTWRTVREQLAFNLIFNHVLGPGTRVVEIRLRRTTGRENIRTYAIITRKGKLVYEFYLQWKTPELLPNKKTA